jgi:hypothetical protein
MGVDTSGVCKRCRKDSKFTAANNMDPGPGPPAHLPKLTSMEEIMIAPIQVFMQVWQIRGMQYTYSGHVCNFARDVGTMATKLPLLPEECDVVILRRRATGDAPDELPYEDFRVRAPAVRAWLEYLKVHHPTFRTHRVEVDEERLQQLPENALVHDRVRSIEEEEPEPGEEFVMQEGPPQGNEEQVS